MAQASSSSGLHAVRIASGYSSSKVKHSVHSSRPSSSRGTKVEREGSGGCLEIIPGEGKGALFSRDIQNKQECDSRPGSAGSRPGSGSLSIGQRAPPVNRGVSAASLRTPTPTKQVKLQAVARKEIDETSFGDLDWEEYQHLEASRLKSATKSHSSSEERKTTCLRHDLEELSLAKASAPNKLGSKRPGEKATIGEMKSSAHAQCKDSNRGAERSRVPISAPGATSPQEAPPDGVESLQQLPQATTESELIDIEDSDQFDTDLEDGGEGGDGNSDEEPPKAPSQLLMEFLTCMMDKDYKNAHKLCTMILLYEPQHEEATKFKPLIEEKMKLEEEAANQSGSDVSSDDDSDDDDEDEETDDSSDDTDTSEEESGSDETEEGGGTQGDLRTKCAGDR